ncbi:Protein of unknown function [Cotesia congregata]|uniref:Uncharacterized protein n=1 Tax=Cotesia congregata TaxID=51543 RepID=A0A8J2HC41_COTCN|nr:Protein of unknown function [Cotesia congregata]
MNEESRCGELQQLVREEEEEENEETTINASGEATPPTSPDKSQPSKNNYIPHASSTSSEQATSQGSMVSGKVNSHGNHHQLLQQSRVMYVNEKDKQRSSKSDFTSRTRQHRGKDCSMEQMTEIREQQERLARMHFEIGQQQPRHQEKDTSGPGQSSANMRHLLHRLQQLSMCIEKLHNK